MSQQQFSSEPTPKELRQFGLIFGLILTGVFVLFLPWLKGTAWPVWPWFPACLFWFVATFAPSALQPVYRAWMKLAMIINAVVTRAVLGIVYYLVVSPMGLAMKLMGKDPMARQWMAALRSYRQPSQSSTAHDMERPF
jgi:hypothetical protein